MLFIPPKFLVSGTLLKGRVVFKFTSLSNDSGSSVLNILKFLELYFPTNVEQEIASVYFKCFQRDLEQRPAERLKSDPNRRFRIIDFDKLRSAGQI